MVSLRIIGLYSRLLVQRTCPCHWSQEPDCSQVKLIVTELSMRNLGLFRASKGLSSVQIARVIAFPARSIVGIHLGIVPADTDIEH